MAASLEIVPWRTRDLGPEKKDIVVDAASGKLAINFLALVANREYGDILFEPKPNPGDYYVYFMPYR